MTAALWIGDGRTYRYPPPHPSASCFSACSCPPTNFLAGRKNKVGRPTNRGRGHRDKGVSPVSVLFGELGASGLEQHCARWYDAVAYDSALCGMYEGKLTVQTAWHRSVQCPNQTVVQIEPDHLYVINPGPLEMLGCCIVPSDLFNHILTEMC